METLTPGSTYLKSHTNSSRLSSLENRLRKTDDDDGPISQAFITKRNRSLSAMSASSLPHITNTTEPEVKDTGIPPFTYEPGPEYEPPTGTTQYSEENKQILDFIQNHPTLQNYTWNDNMIKNIDEHENPYFSTYADY